MNNLSRYRAYFIDSLIINRAILLSIGILLGRVSGLAREWIVAKEYGTSESADLFSLALIFPELLSNILSAVCIGAVLYPLLQQGSDPKIIFRNISKVVLILSAILFFILCGIATIIFQHFSLDKVLILAISLLSVFPNAIAAVSTATLHFYGRIKIQAIGTAIFNCTIIIGLMFFPSIYLAGVLILVAATVRMLVLQINLRKHFQNYSVSIHYPAPAIKGAPFGVVTTVILLAAISQLLPILTPFVDRLAISYGRIGDVAVFSYAEKLCMIPVSLVLTILPYAAMPEIYQNNNSTDNLKIGFYTERILLITLGLGLLFAFIFNFFAFSISNFIFSNAGLELESIQRISTCLKYYSCFLPFIGPFTVLSTALLAKNYRNKLAFFSLQAIILKVTLVLFCVLIALEPGYIGLTTTLTYIYITSRMYYFYKKIQYI